MDILYLFDFIILFMANIDCAINAVGNSSVPNKGKTIFIAGFVLERYKRQPQKALRLKSASAQCSIRIGLY